MITIGPIPLWGIVVLINVFVLSIALSTIIVANIAFDKGREYQRNLDD